MKDLVTTISIQGSPEVVWKVLVDFPSYPAWNPYLRSVEGTATEGAVLVAKLYPPDAAPMTFHPRVLVAMEPKELRWSGHLLIPGLFDGEHRFTLSAGENGTTFFTHAEKFTGILVPFFTKTIDDNVRRGFEAMNAALKLRVEQQAGPVVAAPIPETSNP